MEKIKKYPLISFVTIAYGITWLSALPLAVSGISDTEILVLFGLFGPVLSAYIVTRAIHPAPLIDRDPWFWWVFLGVFVTGTLIYTLDAHLRNGTPIVVALIVFPFPSLLLAWMVASAWSRRPAIRDFFSSLVHPTGPWWVYAFVLLYFPVSHYLATFVLEEEYGLWPKDQAGPAYLGLWVIVFLKIFLFRGGVNEESGWRGFLLRGLLEKFNPILATFVIWIIWAVWHLPIELGPLSNMTINDVAVKWLWMIAPTALLTWAYIRSGGSILVCALLHTTMNVTSEFIPITLPAQLVTIVVAVGLFIEMQGWRRLSPN